MAESIEKTMQTAAEQVSVTRFLDYRAYLEAVYTWLKARLGSYSYVRFSLDLQLGRSNMVHLCIRGKRHLRQSSIDKIATSLHLKVIERQYLTTLYQYSKVRGTADKERLMERLVKLKERSLISVVDRRQLEYYAEWYHPVVREIITCKQCDGTAEWIHRHIRPRISLEQARESLNLLEKLQLIAFDKNKGRFVQTSAALVLNDNVESLSLIRYHLNVMDLAKEALSDLPETLRDIRAYTMSVSKETAAQIRNEVRAFQQRIIDLAAHDQQAEVVMQLNLQLFPFVTNLDKDSATEEESDV